MALAYGSHLHLGLIWDSFQKMSKEVTYFQRLILVMNINFPQPFSKIFCPQMVNKYLPRLNQTKKQQIKQKTIPKQTNLLEAHKVQNTLLRRIPYTSIPKDWIMEKGRHLSDSAFPMVQIPYVPYAVGAPPLTWGLKPQHWEFFWTPLLLNPPKSQSITGSYHNCFSNPSTYPLLTPAISIEVALPFSLSQ